VNPRSAKQKGRDFERSVAATIREWTGFGEDDVRHSRAANSGVDIELSKRVKRVFNYWHECKNQKTLSIKEWLRQVFSAQKAAGDESPFVIVFKQHGDSRKLCVIDYEVFLELATRDIKRQRGEIPLYRSVGEEDE
jgi:hypothetical protein